MRRSGSSLLRVLCSAVLKDIWVLISAAVMLVVTIATARASTEVPASPSLPGGVMTIADVADNGTATVEIPIQAPPGTLAPSVSIKYGSHLPDGPLGVGMRLEGLSTIERVPATLAQDGFAGGVTYGPDDRFALDGLRLINVRGVYGANNTTYHTEVETWRQATSQGACGMGPCSFIMTTRQGVRMEFGTTPDSQILAVDRSEVRTWALSRVTDLNGNSVEFSYTQDPLGDGKVLTGQAYPLSIRYTINTSAGMTANRSLRFLWDKRPDVTTRYSGGSKLLSVARLSNIQALIGAQVTARLDPKSWGEVLRRGWARDNPYQAMRWRSPKRPSREAPPGKGYWLKTDPRSRGGGSRGDRSQALAGAQASAARVSGSTARPSKPW